MALFFSVAFGILPAVGIQWLALRRDSPSLASAWRILVSAVLVAWVRPRAVTWD